MTKESDRWRSHYQRSNGTGKLIHLKKDEAKTLCNRDLFDKYIGETPTCRDCIRKLLKGR